ncbi:YrhK family protein [Streptomyces sp. HNM0574]|uniref:YrhK family protein n=1 Tax=Streptomyces sp. HNM0574 TaxID=2714954 RepID=UPI00146A1600|nr:YrhK family protein [Streptomyces sp. HNM0574]NLU66071.1 hypothetical protein [Streptomyces sp. HNM0574]
MPEPDSARPRGTSPLTLHIGREELTVRERYEAASIVNDILIALWFLAGSIMFFSDAWMTAGTWCFVFGSVELLVRPAIRLSRQVHLRRLHGPGPGLHGSPLDY